MTNTLNKVIHNGDEYEFPGWIPNITTGTTSTVSGIRVWTDAEYSLIAPEEWQISIVYSGGWGGWLPAEYQEVEWIGWTNWSDSIPQVYINTWVIASEDIWAWTQMSHTALRDNLQFFSNSGAGSNRWGLTAYPIWNWCPQWQTWHQTNVGYSAGTFYDIKLNWENDKQTLIDWTNIYSLDSWSIPSSDSIRIWDITYSWYSYKCKFFKITDWTTLIRDLVPCYRIADDVVGMYDLVNNVFYTNAWSWTLDKWPDVN